MKCIFESRALEPAFSSASQWHRCFIIQLWRAKVFRLKVAKLRLNFGILSQNCDWNFSLISSPAISDSSPLSLFTAGGCLSASCYNLPGPPCCSFYRLPFFLGSHNVGTLKMLVKSTYSRYSLSSKCTENKNIIELQKFIWYFTFKFLSLRGSQFSFHCVNFKVKLSC